MLSLMPCSSGIQKTGGKRKEERKKERKEERKEEKHPQHFALTVLSGTNRSQADSSNLGK